ncbi:MAG TPA: MMPL family transporter [Thermoplasmata archaeon]|nr:MMPL family transporter [Thermoplasmata archaeon]
MSSPPPTTPGAVTGAGSPLGWLGHRLARHPWRALLLWVGVLAVCLLPASAVGSVITGSFSNPLPGNDESVQAQNAFAQQFPHAQGSPSSAIVLLESPDITGAAGKNATLGVTSALSADPRLHDVSSVESLYSAYSGYLSGQVLLAWSFLGPALGATPSLPSSVNLTSQTLWAPEASYLHTWQSLVANQSGSTPASAADAPAYNQTRAVFASNASESAVLAAFYTGDNGSVVGFNASIFGGCLTTSNATACADAATERALPSTLPGLFDAPRALAEAEAVLLDLDLGNWSAPAARQAVAAEVLGAEVGIAPAWLLTVWTTFPTPPSNASVQGWVTTEVEDEPLSGLPLPIPGAIYGAFVNPANDATIVVVAFSVDDTVLANGSSITYGDVAEIDTVVGQVLGGAAAYRGITAYETGSAPLDGATNHLATSALSLLLVLTIVVLLVIMLLYFRAPSAPLLAFGMIGIALVVAFAAIFAVGTFVMKFNSEIESIVLVFLMSVGTDYSVFLLARYREELVRGTPPTEAVETTVRWAGQSIATSGLAVMVVAVALTLSGISFLTELGICLLIAVGFALVVNLTVLPAILVLVGPRIFWPNSGRRFVRYAERRTRNIATHRDYIARAGRAATRRPLAVIALILLFSVPVVVVAVQVPVSYDITNIGLPASNPAQVGFVHLEQTFGASYASTSYALVTFSAPVMTAAGPNAPELTEVGGLARVMNATPGVAGVETLVGAGGAPLGAWLNFTQLPPAEQVALNASRSTYVGADGTTVLFNLQTNASGFTASAVGVVDDLQQRVQAYDTSHPGVVRVLLGGAAPTTQDIRSLVNQATDEMLIGAAVGLVLLMLVILGSAFVPLLALGVIGLSILWSWAGTYFVVGLVENEALIFLLPLILLILVLGLGMDYNVLLLTRVKEERILGNRGVEAIRDAVTHAGGVITAAAVILGGAFLLLGFTSPLGLLAAIGLGIGFAVLLQAFVVQLFFTPAVLTMGKDWIWKGLRRRSGP